MNVLRAVAYVLTSLASALFIFVVIYGYVQISSGLNRLQNAFPSSPPPSISESGPPPSFSEPTPPPGSTGDEMYCFYNPEDPLCPPQ
jgi:hypothetical protein